MSRFGSVKLYDTTLRDGTQAEDIAFSLEDKIRIAQKLDELGIHYIEGGWPGSNPKDLQFFQQVKKNPLSQAKMVAFGSTCRADTPAKKDRNIQALIEAGTEVVTIFGKSWDIHPIEALNITLDQNLEIIHGSIRFLKDRVSEVIFDAEHFFDGYKSNPQYALSTLKAAQEAYRNGDAKQTEAAFDELRESVVLANDSLKQTGKNPRRSPRHIKNAEIKTRALLRRLDDFRPQMSPDDRDCLDKAQAAIQKVHDELLTGIRGEKRKR